tara:strand:+ start:1300 stop:1608 length:309 start_codon:yes stop_codon:yes gene_type:complete
MVKRVVNNNGSDGVGPRNFELEQVNMECMVMVRSVDGKLRSIMRWIAFRCFAVDARITDRFDGADKAWPPKIPSCFELYRLTKTVSSIETGMKIVPYCTLHG